MAWRIAITHRTGYRYKREVTSSYNEARITPISNDRQLVLESTVAVTPPVVAFRYWDYWGTLVHAFDIHVPHIELSIVGTSVVETSGGMVLDDPPVGWSDLARPELRDKFAELLAPTAYVPLDEAVLEKASVFATEATPDDACRAVLDWVRGTLRYEKGTTTVTTLAADVLSSGSGVCQDFAHVALALLRATGIPARYVSGYLHPSATAEIGETVAGESHAWIEAWTGDWQAFDPTSGAVGERHVVVGRARDYADLAPLQRHLPRRPGRGPGRSCRADEVGLTGPGFACKLRILSGMPDSTTVRVSRATRDNLRQLADDDNVTLDEEINRLVRCERQRRIGHALSENELDDDARAWLDVGVSTAGAGAGG